jgi:hypothetical protein
MNATGRALRYLEVVLASAWLQITGMRGSPFPILLGVVQPAAYLVITMHGHALTPETATTDMLGTAMMTLWGSTVWSAGGILRRERAQGTLPQLIRGWCDARVVLFGKCLGAVAVSGSAISITTTAMMLALDAPVRVERPLPFVALTLLSALSTVDLGGADVPGGADRRAAHPADTATELAALAVLVHQPALGAGAHQRMRSRPFGPAGTGGRPGRAGAGLRRSRGRGLRTRARSGTEAGHP